MTVTNPAHRTFALTVGDTGYIDADTLRTAIEKVLANDTFLLVEEGPISDIFVTLPWRVRIGEQTIAAVSQVGDAANIIDNRDIVLAEDLCRASIVFVGS